MRQSDVRGLRGVATVGTTGAAPSEFHPTSSGQKYVCRPAKDTDALSIRSDNTHIDRTSAPLDVAGVFLSLRDVPALRPPHW